MPQLVHDYLLICQAAAQQYVLIKRKYGIGEYTISFQWCTKFHLDEGWGVGMAMAILLGLQPLGFPVAQESGLQFSISDSVVCLLQEVVDRYIWIS